MTVGWNVFREHWRKGYGAEAAQAALDYAFRHYEPKRVIAFIDPKNLASIRVSEKLGMRFEAAADFYGAPTSRYVVER